MLGIRTYWSKHFGAFKDLFGWIKDPKNQERVAHDIAVGLSLTKVAAPVIENIAGLVAGKEGVVAADSVIAAADRIGNKVEAILNEPDYHRKVGLGLDLAGNAVREELKKVVPTFDHALEIDGRLVSTAEQLDALPNSTFHTIAQDTIRVLKITGDIGGFAKSVIENPTPPAEPAAA